ncbi:MAG TPA: hypothetical protein VK453_24090 [Micromonosporaceae bacterium]|nr:hypothetical protein [Micromonosporaceae bacterium]
MTPGGSATRRSGPAPARPGAGARLRRSLGGLGRGRVGRHATLRLFAPYLLVIGAALASIGALVPSPPAGAPPPRADYVTMIGAAGLRWDDVTVTDTPTLWLLAQRGSVAALSARSARRITCPADGWVTLGAGNYARRMTGPVTAQCPPLSVAVEQSNEVGASLADQREVVRDNRASRWGAQPGALAESVRCTSAVGSGAAVAAARPYGRIDRYRAGVDANLAPVLAACALSIVDAGTVDGEGISRRATARRVDAQVAAVLAARPERALILVAGLADTADTGRLHVAIANGPGYGGDWLTSTTTGRQGYLELVDLAPTALAALDRPIPTNLFAGEAATRTGTRPVDPDAAIIRLADADREASVQRDVGEAFFQFLVVGQLLLFLAVIPVLRRARRRGGPAAPPPLPSWLPATAEVLLIAAALAVPAALIADLVPWWRWAHAGLVFTGVTVAVLALGTALMVAIGRRHRTLGALAGVAAAAAIAVMVDVLTGSRLQLNGVAGYSAATSGRYAGVGTIALGVLVAGVLLVAGTLAQRFGRPLRPGVMAATGALGIAVVGSPYLGADEAGAVGFSAGVCVAAAMAAGGWLTFGRLAWAGVTAVGVTVGFALVDLSRPLQQRGNIGRFLIDFGDGTGGLAVQRIAESNVVTTVSSPLTALVFGATLFTGFVLLRYWGGLRRLFGLYPSVRAALAGIAVATLIAGLIQGAGLNVVGAAMATAVPLAALAARRALESADDRTQPVRLEPAALTEPPPHHPAAPPQPAPAPVDSVPAPTARPGATARPSGNGGAAELTMDRRAREPV